MTEIVSDQSTTEPFQLFGDWRDLLSALEKAVPGFMAQPEPDRKRQWDLVEGVLKHYAPMKRRCGPFGCGEVLPLHAMFRCADCRAYYCERCIRPHFRNEPVEKRCE